MKKVFAGQIVKGDVWPPTQDIMPTRQLDDLLLGHNGIRNKKRISRKKV
jgi:hypothetical protein